MKGQSSMEFLITVGMMLAFTVPVVFLLFTISQMGYEDTTLAQADASARTLAETINLVYAQGDGATKIILLNTPPTTKGITVSQQGEVDVTISTGRGDYTGIAPTFANIDPNQRAFAGNAGLILVKVTAKKDASGKTVVTSEVVK